ncbi:major facilitator superfamily domain-containing protein [Dipodascopsis uninucleata]
MGFDYFMNPIAEKIGWFPKHMPREERVLVTKLDFLILVFACLSTFCNNLDVNAINNAYVSGMEDDLHLTGNRLSYLNAVYWAATIAFQIPSNAVLTVVPAEYFIPACEIAWGMFTLGTAFVKSYKQLIVMRFFVGITSTPCWIGNAHIINSWYRRQELGKRNAIFYNTYPLGSMFTGYLQTACLDNLAGVGGLEGWRWLFIICTIITIPISALGVIFFPNVPSQCKSRWLTPREKELAQTRLYEEGFAPSKGLTWGIFKRVLLAWPTWVFLIMANMYWFTPYPSTTPFLLWLTAQFPDNLDLVNNLGTTSYAISIVSAMIFAFYSDWRGKRWDSMVMAGLLVLVCSIILVIWDVSIGAKYFAFIALGFCNGPINIVIAWFAECMSGDLEARSISLAIINMGYCILALILPLTAWQTEDQPRFKGGEYWNLGLAIAELLMIPVPIIMERRDRRNGTGLAALEAIDMPGIGDVSVRSDEEEMGEIVYEKKGNEAVVSPV